MTTEHFTNLYPQWESFLKALTDKLAQPTPDLPSVRCVTRQTLVRLTGDVAKELHLPSSFPSGKRVIEHLVAMGLASHVPVEEVSKSGPSRDFLVLGIHDSREAQADPLELLQAYDQQGVICYFSAVMYYGLTTQLPASHHVASLSTQRTEPSGGAAERAGTSNRGPRRSRLGTRVFSYGGVPFFSTRRSGKTIPGVKMRVLGPSTNIRIATLEQTLLDTLQYPFHCGGPEVVLESWEQQAGKVDEGLLLSYLKEIHILPLTRRVGALFDFLGLQPGKELAAYLDEAKRAVMTRPEIPRIPLLRGVDYSREGTWKVLVP